MDSYISWLVAGVIMIALELVLPGAILGILGYCAMMWGVYGLMGKGMTAIYTVGGVTVVLGVFFSGLLIDSPIRGLDDISH